MEPDRDPGEWEADAPVCVWGAEPSGGSGRPGRKGGEVPVKRTGAPGRKARGKPSGSKDGTAGKTSEPTEPDRSGDRESETDQLYYRPDKRVP